MASLRPCTPVPTRGARLAASSLIATAAFYGGLSLWYLYEDFFKYLTPGAIVEWDRVGPRAAVSPYLWTVLSPWRIVGAVLAVALLVASARALLRAKPGARAMSLVTLLGVLLPQLLWYTEFVIDWRAGAGLMDVVLTGGLLVAIPAALLLSARTSTSDWLVEHGKGRLLACGILIAWIGFAASEFVDHAYILDSWLAYVGALVAMGLAAVGTIGIVRLRAWGLWAGIGAALALAAVPLGSTQAAFVTIPGYMNDFAAMTTATQTRVAVFSLLPLALVCGVAAPFLAAFVSRLRGR